MIVVEYLDDSLSTLECDPGGDLMDALMEALRHRAATKIQNAFRNGREALRHRAATKIQNAFRNGGPLEKNNKHSPRTIIILQSAGTGIARPSARPQKRSSKQPQNISTGQQALPCIGPCIVPCIRHCIGPCIGALHCALHSTLHWALHAPLVS